MKKVRMKDVKTDIKKVKKQSWFKPLSIFLLAMLIFVLILSSASVARTSAQRKTSYISGLNSADSGADSAYDLFTDEKSSNDTRNGLMVTLGNLYNKEAKETDRTVEISGDDDESSFYQGNAGTLEQMEMHIRESVLSQMEEHYSEVIEGATGKEGMPGKQGEQGKQGERGIVGAPGRNGSIGKSGSVGATGEKGETGEAGKDGLSTFIAYADNENGTNMGASPKETSKYIGTYQGSVRSSDPKDYTWTEYKDKIITFRNEAGQPTIKIFN